MIMNSRQLRAAGFNLDKVIPPPLEAAASSGMRTRGCCLLLQSLIQSCARGGRRIMKNVL
jgi:hypothetical protein